ncbi:hypothetical protein [Pseudostreptobacillus sp.]
MKIVEIHGLYTVIAIVLIIYLIFKSKKATKERTKRDEEILSTMILLKVSIVYGHIEQSKLKMVVRL